MPRRLARNADVWLIVLIFVLSATASYLYMSQCVGFTGLSYGVETHSFAPAVFWATGKSCDETQPILNDFLEQRVLQLKPDDLQAPGWNETASADKFVYDRLYLLYAVALTWRLLGVSWASLNVFVAFVYAVIAVLLFAVFRLGMGRFLSVIGTLLAVSSPIMFEMLPSIRDFCKAPFILVTLLAVGYLASRPIRMRPLFLLSFALGAAIGVGLGFRQDTIICVPPALFAIGLVAHGKRRVGLPPRLASMALFVIGFLIPAWPELTMTRETGGNNAFYLTQGFTLECQNRLGLQRACYAPLASMSDILIHANICA